MNEKLNENGGGGDGDVIAQATAFTAFPLAAIASASVPATSITATAITPVPSARG